MSCSLHTTYRQHGILEPDRYRDESNDEADLPRMRADLGHERLDLGPTILDLLENVLSQQQPRDPIAHVATHETTDDDRHGAPAQLIHQATRSAGGRVSEHERYVDARQQRHHDGVAPPSEALHPLQQGQEISCDPIDARYEYDRIE